MTVRPVATLPGRDSGTKSPLSIMRAHQNELSLTYG